MAIISKHNHSIVVKRGHWEVLIKERKSGTLMNMNQRQRLPNDGDDGNGNHLVHAVETKRTRKQQGYNNNNNNNDNLQNSFHVKFSPFVKIMGEKTNEELYGDDEGSMRFDGLFGSSQSSNESRLSSGSGSGSGSGTSGWLAKLAGMVSMDAAAGVGAAKVGFA